MNGNIFFVLKIIIKRMKDINPNSHLNLPQTLSMWALVLQICLKFWDSWICGRDSTTRASFNITSLTVINFDRQTSRKSSLAQTSECKWGDDAQSSRLLRRGKPHWLRTSVLGSDKVYIGTNISKDPNVCISRVKEWITDLSWRWR